MHVPFAAHGQATSFLCYAPSYWHQLLRANELPLREVGAEKSKPLGLPIECHRHAAISNNADTFEFVINLSTPATPIPIFVVVVEPAPLTARLAVIAARGEKLQIPIAGLNDTEFRAIRRNGTSDNSRAIEVPDKEYNDSDKKSNDAHGNDLRASSYGLRG